MTYKRKIVLEKIKINLSRPMHLLQIIVGPRQVGKTTAIQQFLKEWPDPSEYVTADQLTPPNAAWVAEVWRRARGLKGERPLLVIDEIQKVTQWSEAVKMLHDEDVRENRPLRVVLLGSSALTLQHGMRESLAGRFQLIPCSHWTYVECRDAFGWALDQFLFYGGYPGAAPLADNFPVWRDYVQNALLETVIGRDIPLLQRIDNPALFRQTLHLACQHPAEIISLQKLLGQLQEKGSINTLANYLELLAGAFLVQPIQKWSERALRIRASSPKLIVRNNALIQALRNVPMPEAFADRAFYGRIVENAVGASMINAGEEVYYWNERDSEVDFVLKRGNHLFALEVKSGLSREKRGLKTFKSRFPKSIPVRIGGENADLPLEDFFTKGLV